jgi:hypothetical protein
VGLLAIHSVTQTITGRMSVANQRGAPLRG